uniref:Uncharacterized protein n=1 Tax=Rhizophora mucronata TaxID=61149 RepID=A0A2P2IPQ2_RHIMU
MWHLSPVDLKLVGFQDNFISNKPSKSSYQWNVVELVNSLTS